MLRNKDKVLDDIARVAGGTVSVFSGIGQNIREDIKSYIDDMADRLDLVPREDFERLELQVAALQEKIDKLEKASQKPKSKPKSKAKPKTTKAKTTKAKK
ncbi:MAG: accessory factor UbiK family protein [Alphaproteobacteria bacterium]|nr:accessory factor UbiK family protein [Alphaproteobacteria bacterium]